jgi:hypothetical protein
MEQEQIKLLGVADWGSGLGGVRAGGSLEESIISERGVAPEGAGAKIR